MVVVVVVVVVVAVAAAVAVVVWVVVVVVLALPAVVVAEVVLARLQECYRVLEVLQVPLPTKTSLGAALAIIVDTSLGRQKFWASIPLCGT